jgi:hypothetical protein
MALLDRMFNVVLEFEPFVALNVRMNGVESFHIQTHAGLSDFFINYRLKQRKRKVNRWIQCLVKLILDQSHMACVFT